MAKKTNINWNEIDWTKRNCDIASALGMADATISYHRRKYDARHKVRASYRINWENTDWNKTDVIIADEKLVTPAGVSLARLKYAPDSLKRSPGSRKANEVRFKRVTATETAVSETTTINVTPKPQPAPAKQPVNGQPGFVKRVLIKVRDWLFNLCVSVEKEAGK